MSEKVLFINETFVDMTGLKGNYDIDMDLGRGSVPVSGGIVGPVPPPDPQGQTILTALKKQLGLKIESRRVPMDVIVIDHVERPSPH